ncbi:MAG TPA: PorV/PorQ family protein [Bacteroidota bacterium]|nr:PorV/PorQ family protein [Bacteroidota bacterium]
MKPFFRRSLIIPALVLAGVPAALAGSGSTFDFLRTDVGARAGAVGGGILTLTDDPNLLFYNPAGIATLSRRRVSFGYFKHLLDINSANVSWGEEISGFGYLGAGALYMNYGEFQRTGEEGQNLGTFGAGELSLSAAYANGLTDRLRYGTAVKLIYSSIGEYSSSAVALDFGAQFIAVPDRVVLGLALLHLGTQLDPYATVGEDLPLDLRFGIALSPEHLPATFVADVHRLTDRRDSFTERFKAFSVGVEFVLSPNVFLRAGYNNERRQDLKIGPGSGLAGFSIGTGIATGDYQFDYAFTSNGPVGAFHRFSLSF